MSDEAAFGQAPSDVELIERSRSGDQGAFAELWRRHYRSGARVARRISSTIDADDLVSEAFMRIYQLVLAGDGPSWAFRPYLYATIRNLAASWSRAPHGVVNAETMADVLDPATVDDPAVRALDRSLTATAFRSLPARWQEVLWYLEIEGMDPHEVAPIMGMTPNGVAALSYRAREGLRKAWLQAHVNDDSALGECRWAISRIGPYLRNGLTDRESERMVTHLALCTRCGLINDEIDDVSSRLALVLIPALLGGIAGGAFLAASAEGGSAMAAAHLVPAFPGIASVSGASASAATSTAGATGIFGATVAPASVIGAVVLAVALSGSPQVAVDSDPPADPPYSGSADAEATVSGELSSDTGTTTLGVDGTLGSALDAVNNLTGLGIGDDGLTIPLDPTTTVDNVVGQVDDIVGGTGLVDADLVGTVEDVVSETDVVGTVGDVLGGTGFLG